MLKKKILKIALVLACITVLIMPYTTTVLAANLTHEDTTAELQISILHEGGEESSGTLTEEQQQYYDESQYGYYIGDTRIYKIIEKGDTDFTNAFYCLNAVLSFPGITSSGSNSLTYTNVGDFDDVTDLDIQELFLSVTYSEDKDTWLSNYNALVWLVDNVYLSKQTPEQKDSYLEKAFADYDDYDIDTVKAFLTDDDIDVVQQYAIWYFTNNDTYNYDTLPTVRLSAIDFDTLTLNSSQSYGDIKDIYAVRQDFANQLYQYLISAAKAGESETEVTYPSLENLDNVISTDTSDDYYVVGPYKINSGTADSSQYTIELLDQNGNEITDYKIKISGEDDFTSKTISEVFDEEFDIYIPKDSSVTTVQIKLSYSTYETEASVWEAESTDGTNEYQPVVLITRENTPHIQTRERTINKTTADLALRKYIVKVNDTKYDRAPTVDVTGLKNGTSTTAEYNHAKDPVTVSAGDTIVYEIRVYNEADIDADGTIIVDALPNGLELAEDSTINETYGWTEISTGDNVTVYKSEYLKDTTIEAFDKENDTTLDSAYVQIECVVSDSATASSVLTNIAEIYEDDITDRDSTPGNNDYINNDYDTSKYTGDTDNKDDLTDDDYYYKGREDDDDFEKVVVEGKSFDLSLQKFVTKINGTAPSTSREPTVDVTPLKNGYDDAKYTTIKTPLSVSVGDIVTYTIRVYNEGEIAGYAEEVSDYLPAGLGFLVGYTTNVDNYWSIPSTLSADQTVSLTSIENGTANLSVDDFNDITSLSEVEVVVGNVKLTSTKLKSSSTDTKNLIEAFDTENGTSLDYRDIQITCIVLSDDASNYNLRNIAEITDDSDENREEVTDRDSNPDTVDQDNYPGDDADEDDNDYENLTPEEEKYFDLSLQKFITGLNDTEVTGREPSISVGSDGTITFTSTSSALQVANNDLITYTIRVYNEGDIAGYAAEVADDLPDGLEYVTDNETNVKYGWKLYDKNGNETTDLTQAVSVRTDYLSKEKSEARGDDCLIDAYDGTTLDYRDVQIVFKVVESDLTSSDRTIKNIAEITEDEDENGDPIDDRDSTPDNSASGEDDIDDEQVYVKYFDLSLQKDLVKIIITENGTTREISVSSTDGLQKVEIHRKRIDSTVVKFVYNITVTNEGEIAGYATEIKDYIPDGLTFVASDNTQWTQISTNVITTNALANTLIEPGASASVQVVLQWVNGEDNFGLKTNVAEISADDNASDSPDIDSTPNNAVDGEDDIDDAPVMLQISTGTAPTYIALTTSMLAIIGTGIVLIKKYVLI